MLRRIVVPAIVVIAVVVALASLSYPSVSLYSTSTETLASSETYPSQYLSSYSQAAASTYLAGYSSSTAWYPGNPICDPMSNACSPFPTPITTFVYPETGTYTYQVTLNTQATSIYTTWYTYFSTQTSSQTVPPYSLVGLSAFQFGLMTIVAIAVIGMVFVFLAIRTKPKPAKLCQTCHAENSRTNRFCEKCGAHIE